MPGNFKFTSDLSRLSSELEKKIANNKTLRDKIDDFLLEETQYYQENSPVGATKELIAGWDITPAKKQSNLFSYVRFSIKNDSNRSVNRIGGREPGKMPPIEPIAAWAAVVLGDASAAYPVAKKIAKEGTQRYRDGDNWVGSDYKGSVIPGGRIDTFAQRLVQYINKA